jgi:hypothetical protein
MKLSSQTGIIDGFRTERKRHIYHVTYSDADEEEWSQRELRDGYVLGLAPEIEAQWKTLKETRKDKDVEDRELNNEEDASDGEGSLYDASSEEETSHRKAKRRKEGRGSVRQMVPWMDKSEPVLTSLLLRFPSAANSYSRAEGLWGRILIL